MHPPPFCCFVVFPIYQSPLTHFLFPLFSHFLLFPFSVVCLFPKASPLPFLFLLLFKFCHFLAFALSLPIVLFPYALFSCLLSSNFQFVFVFLLFVLHSLFLFSLFLFPFFLPTLSNPYSFPTISGYFPFYLFLVAFFSIFLFLPIPLFPTINFPSLFPFLLLLFPLFLLISFSPLSCFTSSFSFSLSRSPPPSPHSHLHPLSPVLLCFSTFSRFSNLPLRYPCFRFPFYLSPSPISVTLFSPFLNVSFHLFPF